MTDHEAHSISDCGFGCNIIGGPFIAENPQCPKHNSKLCLNDLAWEIIFDLMNLRLISTEISVKDPTLNLAQKFILKRLEKI